MERKQNDLEEVKAKDILPEEPESIEKDSFTRWKSLIRKYLGDSPGNDENL